MEENTAPLVQVIQENPDKVQNIQGQIRVEVSKKYLSSCRLFIAAPCFGGMCNGSFSKSMMDLSALCASLGIRLQAFMLFNESLITRARNYSVDEFMRSDASHFLFIDSDIGFDPQSIIQLMSLQTEDSNYDVIGAAYPKKCISWEKIVAAVNAGFADENPNNLENFVGDYVFNPKNGGNIRLDKPSEVLEIGTGFMMVKRSAFEKFRDAHPEFLYRPDHVRTEHFDGKRQITQYFQAEIDQIDFRKFYETKMNELINKSITGELITSGMIEDIMKEAVLVNSTKSNRYLSEDYWFCQKMIDLGCSVWLCPWMRLSHSGSMIFGGSLVDIARLGCSPTADIELLDKFKNKNKK